MVVLPLVVDGVMSGFGLENNSHLAVANNKTPKINTSMARPSGIVLSSLLLSRCNSPEVLSKSISSRLIELTSNTLSLPTRDFNTEYSWCNRHSCLDSLLCLYTLIMATTDREIAIKRMPTAIESSSKFLSVLAVDNIVRAKGAVNIATTTQAAVVEF